MKKGNFIAASPIRLLFFNVIQDNYTNNNLRLKIGVFSGSSLAFTIDNPRPIFITGRCGVAMKVYHFDFLYNISKRKILITKPTPRHAILNKSDLQLRGPEFGANSFQSKRERDRSQAFPY